eukprot:TRINITY_DN5777_c0_g1_i1.p1 TRINITY_DN5777_c0_g1~~TRINITY_DN5777_c0_g1_i1.p1  ORF type:complete len:225 (-),score=27.36 TRINITY_DN5777_c0_g1_i1:158-832(-)
MAMLYTVVSRGTVVLAEHTTEGASGNFALVAQKILQKLDISRNSKTSFQYDRYQWHVQVSNGIIFMTLTDEAVPKRLTYAFLDDIRKRFGAAYGEARRASAYQYNDDFKPVIRKQVDYFTNDPKADKIGAVQAKVDEVKEVVLESIDRILERGEKLELLVSRTEQLSLLTGKFKTQATTLRRTMWWRNVKLWILIIVILILVIFFIVVGACGGFTFYKCRALAS